MCQTTPSDYRHITACLLFDRVVKESMCQTTPSDYRHITACCLLSSAVCGATASLEVHCLERAGDKGLTQTEP